MKNRKLQRHPALDYSTPGAYAVTISTHNRQSLLAFDRGGHLCLSDTGKLVAYTWRNLWMYKVNAFPDHFAVMPDHFHGIILLNLPFCDGIVEGSLANLSDVIKSFKQYTQTQALKLYREIHGPNSYLKLWHKSFYDTKMKDDIHLYHTRMYILNNELSWKLGKYGIPR